MENRETPGGVPNKLLWCKKGGVVGGLADWARGAGKSWCPIGGAVFRITNPISSEKVGSHWLKGNGWSSPSEGEGRTRRRMKWSLRKKKHACSTNLNSLRKVRGLVLDAAKKGSLKNSLEHVEVHARFERWG